MPGMTDRRSGRVLLALAALAALLGATAPAVAAQQEPREAGVRRVTVRVRQVAAENVYLDVGSDHGVVAGDTLEAAADSSGPVVGRLAVVASTATRAVLAFVGPPFPVTRGASLTLLLTRPGRAEVPEGARPVRGGRRVGGSVTADRSPQGETAAPVGAPHGRVSFDLSALHSVTTFGGADPESVGRTYATPTVRFQATVPEAVGGFDLRTSMRLAYRYADGGFPAEPFSGRVYLASLERAFESVPLRVGLGRFSGPTESFSGYWDGLHLRLGGRSLGVSVLAGFQPELWNEGFSTALPKGSLVVDWRASGAGWRWMGDVSAHAVRPREEGVADHTYLGLGQALRAGPVRLDQELQVDRDVDGGWKVGRLRLRGSVRVAPSVDLRAGVSRRRGWMLFPVDEPLGPARDRVSVGVSVRPGRGRVAVDVSATRREGGGDTRGVTASASSGPLSTLQGVELGSGASWWEGDAGHAVGITPFLGVTVGAARLRGGYRFYRTRYLERESTRHGVDGTVRVALDGGWWASGRVHLRWGDGLRSEGLNLSLARSF